MTIQKTIMVSVLMTIIGTLAFTGGSSLNDSDVYFCQSKNVVMKCNSLSNNYGLDNGKCNNAEVWNKLCSTGWIKIVDEIIIENKQTNQWLCDTEKCIPKGVD